MPLSAAVLASFDTPLLAVGEGLEPAPQVGGDCPHVTWLMPSPRSAAPSAASDLMDVVDIISSPYFIWFRRGSSRCKAARPAYRPALSLDRAPCRACRFPNKNRNERSHPTAPGHP